MSNYLIQGETLTAIAEAIRTKTEGTDLMTPEAMVSAIAGLGGGLPTNIKAITAGVYTPPQQMSDTVSITHNLGVQPDFVLFIRSGDAITGSGYSHMLYTEIVRRVWRSNSTTMLASQVIVYHSSSDTTYSTRLTASTQTEVEDYMNAETFQIRANTTYPITYTDHVWVCCAFENYNAG